MRDVADSVLDNNSEIEKRGRAHKEGAENVGLQTKSSLGLNFRTTGWFIYRGDGLYPNWADNRFPRTMSYKTIRGGQ